MQATSPEPGTTPVLQSAAVFQVPPESAVQESVHAGDGGPLPAAVAGVAPAVSGSAIVVAPVTSRTAPSTGSARSALSRISFSP